VLPIDGGVAGARPTGVATRKAAGAATTLESVMLEFAMIWPSWWNAYDAGLSLGPTARVKDPGVGDGR